MIRKITRMLTSETDEQGNKRQVEVERYENGFDLYDITDNRDIEAVTKYLDSFYRVETAGNASSSFDGIGAAELSFGSKEYSEAGALDAARFVREARQANPVGMDIIELAFIAELGPVALGQRIFPRRRKQVQIAKAKESLRTAIHWLVEFNAR